MKILDAFNLVIQKAFDLEKFGITVTKYPIECDDSDAEASELAHNLWCNIVFAVKDSAQMDLVYELKTFLFLQGIYFDSGAFIGDPELQLEWQIDWSFEVKNNS